MRLLARLARNCRASAAAEMALVLPAFAFVLLNVVDLSIYMYSRMQVDLAAQEAVGAARVITFDNNCEPPFLSHASCADLDDDMEEAAQAATTLGDSVGVGEPTEGYYCANTSGELISIPAPGGVVPANCSGTVSGSTAKPGVYISVSATYAFSPIFPGASIASALTTPITRTAWMRLQ